MRKVILSAIAAMLLPTLAAAADRVPSGEAALAKVIAGAAPGKPQTCLSTTLRRPDSQTLSGVGIFYKDGRTVYVNRFQGGCPQLGSFSIIVTRTSTTQLCRGDIARIVDQTTGIQQGACAFGDFVPYTLPKK